MYTTWRCDTPNRTRRIGRSRNGCLTCRRRKVRCDQQQPRCGHCIRLHINCTWKDTDTPVADSILSPSSAEPSPVPADQRRQPTNTDSNSADRRNSNVRPEDIFDFAGFLWSEQYTPPLSDGSVTGGDFVVHPNYVSLQQRADMTVSGQIRGHPPYGPDVVELQQNFKRSEAPPLLRHVETQSKWNAMRDLLLSMASTSPMVKFAIAAFSTIQYEGEHGLAAAERELFYNQSQEEISYCLIESDGKTEVFGAHARNVLAALFLLIYTDLVTNRTNLAHQKLRRAFNIVSCIDADKVDSPDRTLISWFRLLDARAVSAGGEGLFLQDANDNGESNSRSLTPTDKDVEAVVSDLLLKPSQRLLQKTQVFMGRITKIDQWHRTRGTVEDESEVMNIAAQIRIDNHKLYQHRHPLLDIAVAGKLQSPLLCEDLADRITRSSRVAIANYHATFIHLHRVAYRHLPRTKEVCDALVVIKQLTHAMVEAQQSEATLPVNMLWPLLMWGSEEDSAEERVWILSTIRSISNLVNNAAITADVLEEVLRRQDQTRERMDIRTVMHEIFNSCFAIV